MSSPGCLPDTSSPQAEIELIRQKQHAYRWKGHTLGSLKQSCHCKLLPAIIAYIQSVTKPHLFISEHTSWSHCLFSIADATNTEQTPEASHLEYIGVLLAAHSCL